MSTSALPPTAPEPETPTLLTAPEIPMTPHPTRVLHPSTPQALRRRVFSPIGRTPGSKRPRTSNSRFHRRLLSSTIGSPARTPTPTPSPSTTPTTSTALPTNTPTPPRRCTPSYIKAQTLIANLYSILSHVHTLNLSHAPFSAEVRTNLAGIEWGLHCLLERGDVNQYLFLKKEGRGRGVWMDADIQGLAKRSGFWVRVWRGVRSIVMDFEDGEDGGEEGVDRKKKRGVDGTWDEGESAKKGKYEEGE